MVKTPEQFFYRNIYLLSPHNWGDWLIRKSTPIEDVQMHPQRVPRYRYVPGAWTGVPTRIISSIMLHEERYVTLPIIVGLSAVPQHEGATHRHKYPNYVRVLITHLPKRKFNMRFHLHLFPHSLEAVRAVYEDVMPIHPGVPEHQWFLGVTREERIDYSELGNVEAEMAAERDACFSDAARRKAAQLLEAMCQRFGWDFGESYVQKTFRGAEHTWTVRIDRDDTRVYIRKDNGSDDFRCITSNPNTPLDDQVAQKLMALSTPALCKNISTVRDFYKDVHKRR